jgi:hypothetical protein
MSSLYILRLKTIRNSLAGFGSLHPLCHTNYHYCQFWVQTYTFSPSGAMLRAATLLWLGSVLAVSALDSPFVSDIRQICKTTGSSNDHRLNQVCASLQSHEGYRNASQPRQRRTIDYWASKRSQAPSRLPRSTYCTIPGCISPVVTYGVREIQCNASAAHAPANISEACPDYTTRLFNLALDCQDEQLDADFIDMMEGVVSTLTLSSTSFCCAIFTNRSWSALQSLTLDCVPDARLFASSELRNLTTLTLLQPWDWTQTAVLDESALYSLETLLMSGLGMTSLPSQALDTMTSLTKVDLSHNQVERVLFLCVCAICVTSVCSFCTRVFTYLLTLLFHADNSPFAVVAVHLTTHPLSLQHAVANGCFEQQPPYSSTQQPLHRLLGPFFPVSAAQHVGRAATHSATRIVSSL